MTPNGCKSSSESNEQRSAVETVAGKASDSDSDEKRSAVESVAGNADLIADILVRLPVKRLTQFKSVSKRWLSLISDPQFSHRHARRNRKPVSALFLCSLRTNPEFAFVPFDDCLLGAPHFQFLGQPGTTLLHSCNGFLCYSKFDGNSNCAILEYNVCNPTTKRSAKIPLVGMVHNCRIRRGYFGVGHKLCNLKIEEPTRLGSELNINLLGIYLAFDPLKSAHYRVVCVWEWNACMVNYQIKIAVYRSEIGLWDEPVGPFTISYTVCFNRGVFWNGRIHWISKSDLVCFDVDGGGLEIMSMPISRGSSVIYFGESNGHLHLVVREKANNALLNVLEMERDYSGWFVKYCCDLNPVIVMTLEMASSYMPRAFSLIFLGRREKEDESHLVLAIGGKILSYNLKEKTTKKLCGLPPVCHRVGWASCAHYKAFPYYETLLEV